MPRPNPQSLAAILRTATAVTDERAAELWAKYRTTGDPTTFNVLWLWIGNRVYPVLRGMLRTDESAEDGVQAVMMELLAKRDNMPAFASAKKWLRGMATNIALMKHRAGGRREANEQGAAKPDTTADDHVARAVDQLAVREALNKLDSTDREIITLIHFERLTKEQAVAEVGCDPKTFTKRLTAAESRLRNLLAGAGIVAGALTCADAVAVPVRAALNPERVAEMLSRAWAATASNAAGWSKPLLVAAGLLLCGGLAVGGWALTREPEQPQPEPPTPVPVPPDARTLQQKNRDAAQQLRPQLQAALQKLVLGQGKAEITAIEAHDTRVRVRATLAHGKPIPFKSRVQFTFDSADGVFANWIAFTDRDPFRGIDPKNPIQTTIPVLGKFSLGVDGLRDVEAAFRSVPWTDPRTTSERAAYREQLEKALAPYLRNWYLNRCREGGRTLRLTEALALECVGHNGVAWLLLHQNDMHFDPQTNALTMPTFAYQLNAKGQVVSKDPKDNEFWTREPIR